MQDYYALLGVQPTASPEEIAAAYRQLAKTLHPDGGGNDALFRLITDAKNCLTDPERRKDYDANLKPGQRSKSTYQPTFPTLARGLARLLPCTVKQLAEFFGVSQSTIYNWQAQYPEFLEAIKEGRVSSDVNVVERLFENATGYAYTTQRAIKVKDITYSETGRKIAERERVEVVDVQEYVPPQTVAQIFWLKNRVPEHFREKLHVEQEGESKPDMDEEERRQAEMTKAVERALSVAPMPAGKNGHAGNGHTTITAPTAPNGTKAH